MMENSQNDGLPHWRLDQIYPSLSSKEMEADFDSWSQAVKDLTAFFDHQGIGVDARESLTSDEALTALDEVLNRMNRVQRLGHQLHAYVMGHVATNSRNAEAQMWMSRLQMQTAELEKLEPRFTAWVGTLNVEDMIAQSSLAQAHAYLLRRSQIQAGHLMSPEEESLAADLNMTGGRAWSRFYSNFSSQISAEVEVKGRKQTLPMTAIRNLAFSPDRDLRQRAYEAELAAWESNAMPIASALNSIKGQTNILNQRRGWDSPLDLAVFYNAIDRETLEVMLSTAKTYFPHFRRYLKAKAKVLGVDRCAWYDLFAPVGELEREWGYEAARSFIIQQFASFSASLSSLAERAFDEQWIDAEPRDGKRGGAFCMFVRDDESRILSNYQPAYGGVSTLAHELGHAYHNLNLANRTYLQRRTPMTLAETASNFCQIIVRNAALEEVTEREQAAILEADLQDATQVIVDITSRFIFESEVFDRRRSHELSADEFCETMVESQKATYGDGLDETQLHPYMWAVKPHYYGSVFYNFPYMFGLLFGLGIYAQYRESPQDFISRYESLLSATGMESASELAERFGIDISGPDFWKRSLDLIVEDIGRFEALSKA